MWWEIRRRFILWGYLRRIRKYGWTGTFVPGDEAMPAFAYSVGFWEDIDAPEVFVSGAPIEIANGLLAEAHRQIQLGELTLVDQAVWPLPWEDGPKLAWRAVHPSQIRRHHFNVAIIYCERQGRSRNDLQAFQLFRSDEQGRFPWETDFDEALRSGQEELYLPYFGPPDDD